MILEAATAAAMFVAEKAWTAESDIPPMRTAAASCSRYHSSEQIRQCLDLKMRTLQQPDGDMWDPNWVSAVTPVNESEQKNTSAAAANPKDGRSKRPVAKKPQS